jgi:hypothetical protein
VSKYLTFTDLVFKDRALLIGALNELGYGEVDEGDALPLYGYRGDERPETAEIVVRRSQLGSLSNDLGFVRTEDGYVPIISEYDQGALHGGRLLASLRTAYSERVVAEVARRLRGTVHRTVEGSLVRIRVRY